MSLLTWSEDYETGIDVIDDQHKKLFLMVNDLHVAMKEHRGREKIGEVLDFLSEYVSRHFQDEEQLMAEYKYPAYVQHKHVHEGLARKVNKLIAGYKRGDTTLTNETSQLLLDWIQEHIAEQDMLYVAFFKEKGLGRQATDSSE